MAGTVPFINPFSARTGRRILRANDSRAKKREKGGYISALGYTSIREGFSTKSKNSDRAWHAMPLSSFFFHLCPMALLSKWLLTLLGWKVIIEIPADLKKYIVAVAPHTSWKDILLGFAVRPMLRRKAWYLGKKELFEGPLGFFFRWTGGKPVDRSQKSGLVEQVAQMFQTHDEFVLGIAPEGTRKKVSGLKTGFYYMAKAAGVPIVPCLFDFEHKRVHFLPPYYPTDDVDKDLDTLWNFYKGVKGANPEYSIEGKRRQP